ncbi:hypothetical protein HY523_01680 [Candidatus Berkelbacteria bacterium]|nr:hypothetical protein [Candidatus Berkelbacteria bacterium]
MYYYLVEPQRQRSGEIFLERLASLTTDLGIAGEIVVPSPVKPIDQLIDIGLTKGYTTLVVVGTDRFLMQAIACLMDRPASERPVLGLVPLAARSLMNRMLGINSFKDALQHLKFRKLAYVTLAEIEPKRYLMTEAVVQTRAPLEFTIDIDDALIQVRATDLIVTGKNQLIVHNRTRRPHALLRFGAWLLGGEVIDRSTSLFHGNHLRIGSSHPVPLMYEGEILARTPVASRLIRRALKIIVARGTVEPARNDQPPAARAEER